MQCFLLRSNFSCRETGHVLNMWHQMPNISSVWQSECLHFRSTSSSGDRHHVGLVRVCVCFSEQLRGEGFVFWHQLCGNQAPHGNHQGLGLFLLHIIKQSPRFYVCINPMLCWKSPACAFSWFLSGGLVILLLPGNDVPGKTPKEADGSLSAGGERRASCFFLSTSTLPTTLSLLLRPSQNNKLEEMLAKMSREMQQMAK